MPLDVITSNSIAYLATSIESVAARVRRCASEPGANQVLEWATAELERLSGEANELSDAARADEATAAE